MKQYTATLKLNFEDPTGVVAPVDDLQRVLESALEDAVFQAADCFGIEVENRYPVKFEEDLVVTEDTEQSTKMTAEEITASTLRKAVYDCFLAGGYGLTLSKHLSGSENIPDLIQRVSTLLFEAPEMGIGCKDQIKLLRKAHFNLKTKGTFY